MRSVSFIIFILILNYAFCQKSFGRPIQDWSDNVIENYIKQPLDHFDEKEKRTFDFLYYTKNINKYSRPNTPIYIWLTGEEYLNDIYGYFGYDKCLLDNLAKETNGSMYLPMRRYKYFLRHDILPHDKNYYKFLTTEQVLADYAYFIKNIKSQPGFESSKVVLVGTKEGGREATWMRMVYPDLVDAVVASSAAILAKKDFKEYFDVIFNVYEKYGTPNCLDKIERNYNSVEEQFKTPDGIQKLIQEYEICKDVDFSLDIDKKQFWYHGMYYDDCLFATMNSSSYIKTKCENSPTETFRWNNRPNWHVDSCFNCHVDYWKNNFDALGTMYLECSEFGSFPYSDKQPFNRINLDYHLQGCNIIFGIDEKRIDEGIAKTNAKFGGLTPNVTNVVFTYGEIDPYRLLGVQKNLSDTVVSFVIDGAGGRNVPYISSTDSKELVEARKAVISLIKKWIS